MALIATPFKRLFLRNLLWSSEDSGGTLYDALKSAAKAQIAETAQGRVIYQASVNGHLYSWNVPPNSSPQDIAHMLEDLLTRYEEAEAYLQEESEIEEPTDAQIFAEMKRHLKAVRSYTNDYGGSRDEMCEVDD